MDSSASPHGLSWEVRPRMLLIEVAEGYQPGAVVQLMGHLAEDPTYPGPLPALVDFRSAVRTPSEAMIRRIANRLPLYHGIVFTKIAVVVADDVQFGVARQTSAYCEVDGFELDAFRAIEPALKWLDFG